MTGGCKNPELAISNQGDVSHLNSSHEEADSRLTLHVADAHAKGYERIIVVSRDTDVLALLAYHCEQMPDLWLKAGTSKKPYNIPVHNIMLSDTERKSLLLFHSLTGSCAYVS